MIKKIIQILDNILIKISFSLSFHYSFCFPTEVQIEPTNICNLKCPLCPRGNGQIRRPSGMMRFEDFKKIIDELSPFIRSVLLWNYGEPFLNKDIFKMIHYARLRGISVKVSTNGQLLDDKRIIFNIINSGLDRLTIALDGVTQKVYQIYRVGGNVNKVIKGIKLLVKEKKRRKSKYPIITLEFLVMRHNEHEIKSFEELSKKLGVDIIALKTINLYENYYLAKKFLPKNPLYSRYVYISKNKLKWQFTEVKKCIRLFDSMMVNWDGSVAPCCYDYNGDIYLGNVLRDGVKKVWNGKKFRKFRLLLLKNKNPPFLCQKCTGGYPNLWIYRKSLNKGIKASF